MNLFAMKFDNYSQSGEDGVLSHLLKALSIETGYFVEFGAWDGKHWSNTYNLYKHGWRGCFIEGMKSRYDDLCRNIPDANILKICAYVSNSGKNSLDNILMTNNIEFIDLLSVDIDSDDLLIWEGVQHYRPKIVIIEYNSVIPFDTRFVNPPGKSYGNSALSVAESAERRGYQLVEGTNTNLFFVDQKLLEGVNIRCKALQEIRDQTLQLRYFFGYDGTLLHDYKPLNDAGIVEVVPIPFTFSFGLQPIRRIFRRVDDKINFPSLVFFTAVAFFGPRCNW